MANEFEDLTREVGEMREVVVQTLEVATEAVDLINTLRTQIVNGLTAEQAASLAASLDADQASLAAKLAQLSDAINPNTQVTTGTGDVSPQ